MNEHENDRKNIDFDRTLPADGLQDTLRQSECKQPVFDVPKEWGVGDVVAGLYEVGGVLGEGAFGTVYKVYHLTWHTKLAVKSPRQDTLGDRGAVVRFLREAETWVKLGMHPNIVTCYYVRELGKIPRIFLEYVAGGSLRKRLQEPLPLKEALDFAIQICRGMGYAHGHGLVHRDLKPENCLLTETSELKVTDFGLVRIEASESEGVSEGKDAGRTGRAGTPEYMAPEQWINASEATFKADIWAFGAVLYELCTGKKTFGQGENEPLNSFYARLLSSNWAHSSLPKTFPEVLTCVVDGCLEVDSEKRPESFASIEENLVNVYKEVVSEPYPRLKPNDIVLLADSLNNRAVSLYDLGYTEEALTALTEALEVDPSHLEATYNRALILWSKAEITDSDVLNCINLTKDNTSSDWRFHYLLGLVHMSRKDVEAAIFAFENALEIAPMQTDPHKALHEARTKREKWPNRLSQFCNTTVGGTFSLDGKQLIIGDISGNITYVDIETGSVLRELRSMVSKGVAYHLILETDRFHRQANLESPQPMNEEEVEKFENKIGNLEVMKSACTFSIVFSPDKQFALVQVSYEGGFNNENGFVFVLDLVRNEIIRLLEGHSGPVKHVAFSPDGKYALTGSEDRTCCFWQLDIGRCLHKLSVDESVTALAFSPSGNHALVAANEVTYLFDVRTGECVRKLIGHESYVNSVAFSPDGKQALTGSEDNTARLWSLETGKCSRILKCHLENVYGVTFLPDGRFALTGSSKDILGNNCKVRFWDLSLGICLRTEKTGHTHNMCFSPDGKFAFIGGSSHDLATVWSLKGMDFLNFSLVLARISSTEKEVAIKSELTTLVKTAQVCINEKQWSKAIDLLKKARALPGLRHDQLVMDLWRQVGQKGICKGINAIWFARLLEGHKNGVGGIVFSNDGTKALAAEKSKSASKVVNVFLWDLKTGKCLLTLIGHKASIKSMSFSPDAQYALTGSEDHTAHLWDLNTGECLHTIEDHKYPIEYVGFSPDGKKAITASLYRSPSEYSGFKHKYKENKEPSNIIINLCNIIDFSSEEYVSALEQRVLGGSFAISPNGNYVLTSGKTRSEKGNYDTNLRLWNLETGCCVKIFSGSAVPDDNWNPLWWNRSVVFSPDGKFIIERSRDKTRFLHDVARLWDIEKEECIQTLLGNEDHVQSMCFSPDGRFALTGSRNNIARIWDLKSGQCVHVLEGHTHAVSSVGFSPDGRYVMTGSEDETVRVWELVWDYDFPVEADWDEGAKPYLETFLSLHTPYTADGFRSEGAPQWTEEGFQKLLVDLSNRGYGWLKEEGVRKKLEELATLPKSMPFTKPNSPEKQSILKKLFKRN